MIRIEDCDTPFGAITIFRAKATGAFIYNQGGCCQSEADSTGVSLASYIHAIFGANTSCDCSYLNRCR